MWFSYLSPLKAPSVPLPFFISGVSPLDWKIAIMLTICTLAIIPIHAGGKLFLKHYLSQDVYVFTPMIAAVPQCIILTLSEEREFSAIAFIGSGVILTICLRQFQKGKLASWALIFPTVAYGYECFPQLFWALWMLFCPQLYALKFFLSPFVMWS